VSDRGDDDEELLEALRQALRARRAVPAEFIQTGKNAFAWRNFGAELAQLTYDSTLALGEAAPTRAEPASIRGMTFTSANLSIELEVTQDAVLGQIIPAGTAMITVQPKSGPETVIAADEIGCFSVEPIPKCEFRLRCQTPGGLDVLTGWAAL
jgi:hypothetical protein